MIFKGFLAQKKQIFISFGFWVGFLSFLTAVYWPALASAYAYHDGLIYFLDTDVRFTPPGTVFCFMIGRYLLATSYVVIGRLVDSFQDLQVVRFLSVVQLSFLGLILTRWLARNFLRPAESFLLICALLTLPPFQILVCQEGMAFYPASLLAATGSFLLCFHLDPERAPKKNVILVDLGAVFLFVLSLTIYQPGAMFFWALVGAYILFFSTKVSAQAYKKIAHLFFVGLASLIVYRVLIETTKGFYLSAQTPDYNPYVIAHDVLAKMSWFFQGPVIKVLSFWNIIPSAEIAIYVAGFLLGAIILAFTNIFKHEGGAQVKHVAIKSLLLIALLFLTSLPNLLYAQGASFYRCYTSLAAFVLFLVLWGLRQYSKAFSTISRSFVIVALCLLACWGALKARQTVGQYRVRVSTEEFKFLKQALKSVDLNDYKRIYIIQPDQGMMFTSDDEFGNLTTSFGNDIIGFVSAGITDLLKKDFKIYHIDYDPITRKAIYFLRRHNEENPSFSYRVTLDFGSDTKDPQDFLEPTLVLNMNRVVDSLLSQRQR